MLNRLMAGRLRNGADEIQESLNMPPVIDKKKCSQCGQCADICSEDVFFGSEKKKTPFVAYPKECWHCNACVLACPVDGAIRLRIPLPMMVCYK